MIAKNDRWKMIGDLRIFDYENDYDRSFYWQKTVLPIHPKKLKILMIFDHHYTARKSIKTCQKLSEQVALRWF